MATTSITNSKQLTIRVGNNTLSFTITDSANAEQPVQHEPYVVKSGISMAANLREAFRTYAGAIDLSSARVLINTPVLMVPIEQFQEADATTLYLHSFPESEKDLVRYNVLPSLNAVCIFCINKDLLMVLTDHFNDVQLLHAMTPVWTYLHQRSFTGHRSKIYGFFHDKQLDICSFQQNRFKFCNSFDTTRAYDAIFFLLYVWKQLNLQPEHDEIHILGEIPDQDWLLQELHKYVKNTFVMPYDPLSYANYHGKI
jgi:hypothetical protein